MRLLVIACLLLSGCATSRSEVVYLDNGIHVITAHGTSMVPEVWPGDKVLISPTRWEDLKLGLMVLRAFPEYPQPVLHRIVAGNKQGWITQGDSNDRPDEGWLVPTNYLGSAVAVIQPSG